MKQEIIDLAQEMLDSKGEITFEKHFDAHVETDNGLQAMAIKGLESDGTLYGQYWPTFSSEYYAIQDLPWNVDEKLTSYKLKNIHYYKLDEEQLEDEIRRLYEEFIAVNNNNN